MKLALWLLKTVIRVGFCVDFVGFWQARADSRHGYAAAPTSLGSRTRLSAVAVKVNIQPTRARPRSCESRRPPWSSRTPPRCAAHPPTDRIAGVAGRPAVDCRSPVRGVLRHMRRHIVVPQIGHKPGHVVSLVCTERDPMIAGTRRHPLEPRLALCRAGCQGQTRVDHQSVPVLHQNVPQIRQLGRLTWPPCFRMLSRGGRLLRYNRALGSVIEACVSLLRFAP